MKILGNKRHFHWNKIGLNQLIPICIKKGRIFFSHLLNNFSICFNFSICVTYLINIWCEFHVHNLIGENIYEIYACIQYLSLFHKASTKVTLIKNYITLMFVCQMCSLEIYNVKYMLISAGKVMKQIFTMSFFYVVSSATKHILPSVNFNVQRPLIEELQSG